jgi:hypothetical protein
LVLRFEFPSGNFANDCDSAIRAGEAFEIVVYAGSGKINSVRRSIAEMRGERGQIYQFSSLFWDKPRTMALWVGLARAMALDWKMDSVLEADLTVRVIPPDFAVRLRPTRISRTMAGSLAVESQMEQIRSQLPAISRSALLGFLGASINELTVRGRYSYDEPDVVERLRETNEAVHRLAGHLRDLTAPDEALTVSRIEGIMEQLTILPASALQRLALSWVCS